MTPLQKKYYKWVLTKNYRDLTKGVKGKKPSLVNIVMELKKCCNHPYLFESAENEDLENEKKARLARLEKQGKYI